MRKKSWFSHCYRVNLHNIRWIAQAHWFTLTKGLHNWVRYSRVIWHQREGDWGCLADVMEAKLCNMAEFYEKHNNHSTTVKSIKQMKVAKNYDNHQKI